MAAVFRVALDANNQRHINCVRETTIAIKYSIETGSHALAVVGLTTPINAQEEMRSDWNTHTMRAYRWLETLMGDVGGCVQQLCDRIGVLPAPTPFLLQAPPQPMRKRPRIADSTTAVQDTPFRDVIDSLQTAVPPSSSSESPTSPRPKARC